MIMTMMVIVMMIIMALPVAAAASTIGTTVHWPHPRLPSSSL